MPDRLTLGVIGLGRMGQLYARTLATQVVDVQLYAVADPNEQARAAVAGAFPVPHVFTEAQDLIALPGLDAVVIATPTSTQADLVIAAAAAGKAIFCE
jgi:myo-inositol 2-dehydrogenase/D-chiro-inositol 1-dehydrogenase